MKYDTNIAVWQLAGWLSGHGVMESGSCFGGGAEGGRKLSGQGIRRLKIWVMAKGFIDCTVLYDLAVNGYDCNS
jgi:hypothetical protein